MRVGELPDSRVDATLPVYKNKRTRKSDKSVFLRLKLDQGKVVVSVPYSSLPLSLHLRFSADGGHKSVSVSRTWTRGMGGRDGTGPIHWRQTSSPTPVPFRPAPRLGPRRFSSRTVKGLIGRTSICPVQRYLFMCTE